MARATFLLVDALRRTALRLEDGGRYAWSHFGQCNCGNLAQTITRASPEQLQQQAFCGGGDWGEQAREYCPDSGYPLDYVFGALFSIGMEPRDVQHLERLSDAHVLRRLGASALRHNHRPDVVRYMRAWAELLEEQLPKVEGRELPLAAE